MIKTPFIVRDVYQRLDDYRLLLAVIHDGQKKVIQFELTSSEFDTIYSGPTNWAQIDSNQRLFFVDDQYKLMIKQGTKTSPVASAENVRVNQKFLLRQGRLLFFDQGGALLSLDISAQELSELPFSLKASEHLVITDVNLDKARLLYSPLKSSRKELVVFEL